MILSPTLRPSTTLRRSGVPLRPVTALLAGLVLAASLGACAADEGDDTASDPAATSSPAESETPESTETPSPDPDDLSGTAIEATGSAGVTEATLLSATEAGGSPSTMAFALDTDRARADFAAQLERGLGEAAARTAAEQARLAPGSTPYAAIAAVGCDAPRAVAIEAGEAGFQVAAKLPRSGVQCFAPMTFVVVFSVPDA